MLNVETRGRLRLITLNRPGVRNAVNPELARALYRAMLAFEGDESVDVAVRRQSRALRHIQMLNPSKGPDWGLFSFCFKGRWQGHPPCRD